jgi:NADPH:quinone reductase-like Zn-dependent oxidoreductase
MAVAMAGAIGATVAVTSSSQAKIDRACTIGALGGVRSDDSDWPLAARTFSPDGSGFDVVVDAVGAWAEALLTLRPGGRLVVLGASRQEHVEVGVRDLYFSHHSILGTTMGSASDMAGLMGLVEVGRLAPPVIDRVFELEDAAAAHEYLERAEHFGKVVLTHG